MSRMCPPFPLKQIDNLKKINYTIMSDEELYELMLRAGAAVSVKEIAVSDELCRLGVKYHSYVRHRVAIMRLLSVLKPKAWWIK